MFFYTVQIFFDIDCIAISIKYHVLQRHSDGSIYDFFHEYTAKRDLCQGAFEL